jgi:PIN domain nuclease of toxin-antitoxin system
LRILLDTHCWLWMLQEPDRLAEESRELLRDPLHELYLSAASTWEMAMKSALGKLRLPQPPAAFVPLALAASRVAALPISLVHGLRAGELPPHHRDPFDRMLVAQAQLESLTLLTADSAFGKYDVTVHWA